MFLAEISFHLKRRQLQLILVRLLHDGIAPLNSIFSGLIKKAESILKQLLQFSQKY
jgi:hypothetical protein